jgi:tetratricopeptide (TPR) repeat protein
MLVGITACGTPARPRIAWPDAPLELRDESDREQTIDRLWVLPPGAERDAVRADIVTALARRIGETVDEDKPFISETLVFELASLWRADPDAVGRGLAGQAPLLRRLRAMFAKSGAIEPTIATLVMLAEVEPDQRAAHLAELDEVLTFSDELAAAENGPHAVRAQPIAQLQATVLALPLGWLVDRYLDLVEQRQRVVGGLIAQQGASMELVRAHYDILATARRIAITLARAGRTSQIHAHLATLTGFYGVDRELAMRAEIVAEQPTADAYYELARTVRNDEKNPDAAASLAICLDGLVRFPDDPTLLVAAAGDAASLGRLDQPIQLYEAAIHAMKGEVDNAIALRLGKLYSERIARLAFGGRPTAATTAWLALARATEHRNPGPVWAQVAAGAETALGRGLLSQGEAAAGERALVSSLERAASIDAYETLATLHFKTGRYGSASRYASAGLALLGESTGDRYHRAKLERIAADVMRAAGKPHDAATLYLDARRTWAALGEDKGLARSVAGERNLEAGRIMWFLGEPEQAVNLALKAIDVDPDSPSTASGAVAFLITIGRPIDALDAYHRGLGSPAISEFYKVYTSLWVLADAHRRGEPRDRLAVDYLTSRHGDLWYEQLAEAATGRRDFAGLRACATTGPRKSELAFYGAALGLDPEAATAAGARRLFEQVVDAKLVMDAEYDLARLYLASP